MSTLGRYKWAFVGWYLGITVGAGILAVLVSPKLQFSGMVVTIISAIMARGSFRKYEERDFDRDESAAMIRHGLLFTGVVTLLSLMLVKSLIDATPQVALTGRGLGMGVMLFAFVFCMALNGLQLWLGYRVSGKSAAAPAGGAGKSGATVAAPSPVRTLRVLVLGSSDSEHALAWKLSQSARVLEVIVAPGNAGVALERRCRVAEIAPDAADAVIEFARRESVELVVVADAAAARAGVVDRLRSAGLRTLGVGAAANLETPDGLAAWLEKLGLAHLPGAEPHATVCALSDGRHVLALSSALRGDDGAVSPAAPRDEAAQARIVAHVLRPLVTACQDAGTPLAGFLQVDVRTESDGSIGVVSLATRLHGTAAVAMLMRLQSDAGALLEAAADARLATQALRINPQPALARELGRAGDAQTAIAGLDQRLGHDTHLFHDRTQAQGDEVIAAGARVLTVCTLGQTPAEARLLADDVAARLAWDGATHRVRAADQPAGS